EPTRSSAQPRSVGYLGPVFAGVALSADGRILAVSRPTGIHLFDATAGKELRKIATSGRSMRLALSADGKLLAALESNGVRLFDALTGAELRRLGPEVDRNTFLLRGGAKFSADGKILATAMVSRLAGGGPGGQSPLVLWDTATGKELRRIGPAADRVASRMTAFSPDGKLLAWIYESYAIILTDPTSGEEVRRLRNEGGYPFASFVFAPDNKTLAAIDTF